MVVEAFVLAVAALAYLIHIMNQASFQQELGGAADRGAFEHGRRGSPSWDSGDRHGGE